MALAGISLTLSRHFFLSFIASGRSSELHPVSSHSCCMYVLEGRPASARPYVEVHRSTSLMSSSLLLQLCPACLVRLTCIVFVMGGRWPYGRWFVGCCRQDLFKHTYIHIYIYIYIGNDRADFTITYYWDYIYIYIYRERERGREREKQKYTIYIYLWTNTHNFTICIVTPHCTPAGLPGAVRSRQVHQLTQGTDVGCCLLNAI